MESERPFTLPRGYVDAEGKVHREGAMRLARAGDEILPLQDPRVKGNRAYLVILLLARVVTRLGDLAGDAITPEVIEGLYSCDLAYLQRLYFDVNGLEDGEDVRCPQCGATFRSGGPGGPAGRASGQTQD
ncbi:MAG: hypothetical protein ACUVYA_08605 [Planctomycetota bacterium]